MKRTITFFLLLMLSTGGAHAQLGTIGGIKNKIANPGNKYDGVARDRVARFNENVIYGEEAMKENNYAKISTTIDECENMIAEIYKVDPTWQSMEGSLDRYNKLKAKFEVKYQSQIMSGTLLEMRMSISDAEITNNKLAKKLERSNFDKIKAYYTANPKQLGEQEQKDLAQMEDFYQNKLPAMKKEALEQKKIDEYMEYTTTYIKENRMKPDFLKNQVHQEMYVEDHVRTLERGISYYQDALLWFKNDTDLQQVLNSIAERKADLEQYLASEDYQSDLAKKADLEIDGILIHKGTLNDPKMEAIVKRDFESDKTIKRISLFDGWYIDKNEFGIPVSKYMTVELGVSDAEGCYKVSGKIICSYKGAGEYGAPYFKTVRYGGMNAGVFTKMKCENMSKNAPAK